MQVIKGSELKELLDERNIRQKTVAEELQIAESTVNKYLNDKIQMPAHVMLIAAAMADLKLEDLVKGYTPKDRFLAPPEDHEVIMLLKERIEKLEKVCEMLTPRNRNIPHYQLDK